MQVRTLVASSVVVLSLSASSLFADEAAREAKVQELFRAAQIQETMQQQMAQSMDRIKSMTLQQLQSSGTQMTPEQSQKMEQMQTHLMSVIQDAFSWDKIQPDMVKIYADTYSDEELDGLIAFYKSPAGQAYVKKTPILMNKTMEIMQQRMAAIQPQMQQLIREATQTKAAPAEQQ
jgi:hypothetical protein